MEPVGNTRQLPLESGHIDLGAGARYHGQFAQFDQAMGLVPADDIGERVRALDEKESRAGPPFSAQQFQRFHCIGWGRPVDINAGKGKMEITGDGQFDHAQAMARR
jgi:hypothetical protein